MAASVGISIAAGVGSAILGNQQKQKAKGDAAQAERDAQAAQAAADAKLQQQHRETIQAESQAGAVARKAMGGTITPNTPTVQKAPPITPPAVSPLLGQRKTLLGQ